MKPMYDCDRNLLDIDDTVAFAEAGYTNLVRGKIMGFTAASIRIRRGGTDTWPASVVRKPENVVKMLNPEGQKK